MHRFAVGQSVQMKKGIGTLPAESTVFQVTRTLPERNNSPQYRIRNDAERHERMIAEDDLTGIDAG